MKFCVRHIQNMTYGNAQTLAQNEGMFLNTMKEAVVNRQRKELATTERLIFLIQEAIERCEPIHEDWKLAPDALAVLQGRWVYPIPSPEVVPSVNEFPSDRLNEEQLEVSHNMLKKMRVGRHLLEEDLEAWLRSCSNPVGPLGITHIQNGKMSHVTLPIAWRENEGELLDEIVQRKEVAGTDETTGTVPLETAMVKLQSHRQLVFG